MAKLLDRAFNILGHNSNSAIYVAVTIAAFKGVFRPIFTMSDKKSDPETKKYTAIREALTELIAIPVYIAVPLLGNKLIVEKGFGKKPELFKKAATTNIKFLGVLLATAIIPAVCNAIQPPIMAKMKKRSEAKKALLTDNKIPKIETKKPSFSGDHTLANRKPFRNNYGMRVGS